MDIKSSGFFGQLQVSGIGTPLNSSGTIVSIVSEFMAHLRTVSPRTLSDGSKSITMLISSTPFAATKVSRESENLINEVEAGLPPADGVDVPLPSDTYESFYDRLLSHGTNEVAANMVAADWFDVSVDPEVVNWIRDPKAQRFRQLNSSTSAYEAALPQEYEQLKHYVIQNYAARLEGITFRTA